MKNSYFHWLVSAITTISISACVVTLGPTNAQPTAAVASAQSDSTSTSDSANPKKDTDQSARVDMVERAASWRIGQLSLSDSTKAAAEKIRKELPKARWHQSGEFVPLSDGSRLEFVTGVHFVAGDAEVGTSNRILMGRKELGSRGISYSVGVDPSDPTKITSINMIQTSADSDAPTWEAVSRSLKEKYGDPDFQSVERGSTTTVSLIYFDKKPLAFRNFDQARNCFAFNHETAPAVSKKLFFVDGNYLFQQAKELAACGIMVTFSATIESGNHVVSFQSALANPVAVINGQARALQYADGENKTSNQRQIDKRKDVKPTL